MFGQRVLPGEPERSPGGVCCQHAAAAACVPAVPARPAFPPAPALAPAPAPATGGASVLPSYPTATPGMRPLSTPHTVLPVPAAGVQEMQRELSTAPAGSLVWPISEGSSRAPESVVIPEGNVGGRFADPVMNNAWQ